jgi:hypothetical protein
MQPRHSPRAHLGQPVKADEERTLLQDLALLLVAVLAMGGGFLLAALAIRVASW